MNRKQQELEGIVDIHGRQPDYQSDDLEFVTFPDEWEEDDRIVYAHVCYRWNEFRYEPFISHD